MSMSLNRAQIIGNLTRDPEVRQTGSGRSVANFGVATSSRWTDSSGQLQEKTEFHNVVAWGKLADICVQYLRKGSKVFVEGRLQTRDWEGEDGVKRYRTEIIADNMIMLDRKGEMTGAPMGSSMAMSRDVAGLGGRNTASSDQDPVYTGEDKINVEDLPF